MFDVHWTFRECSAGFLNTHVSSFTSTVSSRAVFGGNGTWMNMTRSESSENVRHFGKMSYFHHFHQEPSRSAPLWNAKLRDPWIWWSWQSWHFIDDLIPKKRTERTCVQKDFDTSWQMAQNLYRKIRRYGLRRGVSMPKRYRWNMPIQNQRAETCLWHLAALAMQLQVLGKYGKTCC